MKVRMSPPSFWHLACMAGPPRPPAPKGPGIPEMNRMITAAKDHLKDGRIREGILSLEAEVLKLITSNTFSSQQNMLIIRLVVFYNDKKHRFIEAECEAGLTLERYDQLETILKKAKEVAVELLAPDHELTTSERFQLVFLAPNQQIPGDRSAIIETVFRPFEALVNGYYAQVKAASLIDPDVGSAPPPPPRPVTPAPAPATPPRPAPAPGPSPRPVPEDSLPPLPAAPRPAAPAPRPVAPPPDPIRVYRPAPTPPPSPSPPPMPRPAPIPAPVALAPAPMPTDPRLASWVASGRGLTESKRYADALSSYRAALAIDPQCEAASQGVIACFNGWLDQVAAEMRRNNYKGAGTILGKIEAASPPDDLGISGRIAEYRRSVGLRPVAPAPASSRAAASARPAAKPRPRPAALPPSPPPRPSPLPSRARDLFDRAQYAQAAEEFSKLSEANPNNIELLCYFVLSGLRARYPFVIGEPHHQSVKVNQRLAVRTARRARQRIDIIKLLKEKPSITARELDGTIRSLLVGPARHRVFEGLNEAKIAAGLESNLETLRTITARIREERESVAGAVEI